ncbi:uncharacterized membrane protein YgaE (UPF0421/DUF939 family) [Rhodococcus sp. SORGH_AS303]|jgi:hypothetical protein|nr:uncharacterized membrane protein YgaE (UPF0421/DUF939 family) [Rhodococcus sp. SORGH_AS_0303]
MYWDGRSWVGPAGPAAAGPTGKGRRAAANFGAFVLVAIGLLMSMQSVSLLTGSGPIWTGVAVIAVGTALAFFLGASTIVRLLAVLALVLGVVNAVTIENEMSERRGELSRVFDQ